MDINRNNIRLALRHCADSYAEKYIEKYTLYINNNSELFTQARNLRGPILLHRVPNELETYKVSYYNIYLVSGTRRSPKMCSTQYVAKTLKEKCTVHEDHAMQSTIMLCTVPSPMRVSAASSLPSSKASTSISNPMLSNHKSGEKIISGNDEHVGPGEALESYARRFRTMRFVRIFGILW